MTRLREIAMVDLSGDFLAAIPCVRSIEMDSAPEQYPARLEIDFPERLDRLTSFFRLIWIIPIAIVAGALSSSASETVTTVSEGVIETSTRSGGGIASGLFVATVLMIVFHVLPTLPCSPTPTPRRSRSSRCTWRSTTPMSRRT